MAKPPACVLNLIWRNVDLDQRFGDTGAVRVGAGAACLSLRSEILFSRATLVRLLVDSDLVNSAKTLSGFALPLPPAAPPTFAASCRDNLDSVSRRSFRTMARGVVGESLEEFSPYRRRYDLNKLPPAVGANQFSGVPFGTPSPNSPRLLERRNRRSGNHSASSVCAGLSEWRARARSTSTVHP